MHYHCAVKIYIHYSWLRTLMDESIQLHSIRYRCQWYCIIVSSKWAINNWLLIQQSHQWNQCWFRINTTTRKRLCGKSGLDLYNFTTTLVRCNVEVCEWMSVFHPPLYDWTDYISMFVKGAPKVCITDSLCSEAVWLIASVHRAPLTWQYSHGISSSWEVPFRYVYRCFILREWWMMRRVLAHGMMDDGMMDGFPCHITLDGAEMGRKRLRIRQNNGVCSDWFALA